MESTSSFGYWIRRQRKALDLTQQMLAEQAGYSLAAIKKIENDERRPSQQMAERLADILGIAVNERKVFLEVARGLQPVDRLPLAVEPEFFTNDRHKSSSSHHNLPLQVTSFIGREKEIAEVTVLIEKARLVTLMGPGGTGKTRLSIEVANKLLDKYPDGVWIVELAPLSDPMMIPRVIAIVMGLREEPQRPVIDTLCDYLREKQALILLDNCEQVVEACAQLADIVLHACPQIHILTTSREALNMAGEISYLVPSLQLPDMQGPLIVESLSQYEAVRLFVERASAKTQRFTMTDEDASFIAQICHRLDGIPLAIELAAGKIRALSVQQIAQRLDDSFHLLTGGSRTALPRHQTLQAAIEWSYNLLSPAEQTLFRHLSVFVNGWTLDAAEVVCAGDEIKSSNILDLLIQLVNKSLVAVTEHSQSGETRYRMLETIRQYARDKLIEVGNAEETCNRHVDFFLRFAETAKTYMDGPRELEWSYLLDADYDNLRTALEWAMEQDVSSALRLGTALHMFWIRYGRESEGFHILHEALARFKQLPQEEGEAAHQSMVLQVRALEALEALSFARGDTFYSMNVAEEVIELARQIDEKHVLVEALTYLEIVKVSIGDTEISSSMAEEGVTLARQVGDKVLLGFVLTNMAGVIAMTTGDPQKVQAYHEEGIRLLKEAGAHWLLAMAHFGSGIFAARLGRYAEARSQFEACVPLFYELKDRQRINMINSEIAHAERRLGNYKQAKLQYQRTLVEWQRLGHRAAVAYELECLAFIAKLEEDEQRAAILFSAAEMLRENINIPMTPLERSEYEREVSDLRTHMDEAAFKKAWAQGHALIMEQAIEYALRPENENDDSALHKARF